MIAIKCEFLLNVVIFFSHIHLKRETELDSTLSCQCLSSCAIAYVSIHSIHFMKKKKLNTYIFVQQYIEKYVNPFHNVLHLKYIRI